MTRRPGSSRARAGRQGGRPVDDERRSLRLPSRGCRACGRARIAPPGLRRRVEGSLRDAEARGAARRVPMPRSRPGSSSCWWRSPSVRRGWRTSGPVRRHRAPHRSARHRCRLRRRRQPARPPRRLPNRLPILARCSPASCSPPAMDGPEHGRPPLPDPVWRRDVATSRRRDQAEQPAQHVLHRPYARVAGTLDDPPGTTPGLILWRTADAGVSWSRLVFPDVHGANWDLVFLDPSVGWLATDPGGQHPKPELRWTDDGGATWSIRSTWRLRPAWPSSRSWHSRIGRTASLPPEEWFG